MISSENSSWRKKDLCNPNIDAIQACSPMHVYTQKMKKIGMEMADEVGNKLETYWW